MLATLALVEEPGLVTTLFWHLIDEIGEEACLLRCIARRVFTVPGCHHLVSAELLRHTSSTLHHVVAPESGFNSFHASIAAGNECVQIRVCPHVQYHTQCSTLRQIAHGTTACLRTLLKSFPHTSNYTTSTFV